MTRKIQGAWLAAVALLMIPVSVRAQATPAASGPAEATPMPSTVTDEDISMLRADIRAERKQIVAANMTLTVDEATTFWPLFDEDTAEVRKINDRRWAMMKDYAATRTHITDEHAKEHMKISAAVDADLITLRATYMPQFEKLLPPKKAVQFYQIDRRLDLLMNIQLSSLIPVINPTN